MNKVHSFLFELDRAKHRAYGVVLHAQSALDDLASHPHDPQRVEAAVFALCIESSRDAIASTLALVSLASALTKTQQIDLVRASDDTYQAYLTGDLNLMDDLSLKTEAFKYIIKPSPAVVAAHEYHCGQLAHPVGG
jgi:hypothetical protein